jgi:hypothetical protein
MFNFCTILLSSLTLGRESPIRGKSFKVKLQYLPKYSKTLAAHGGLKSQKNAKLCKTLQRSCFREVFGTPCQLKYIVHKFDFWLCTQFIYCSNSDVQIDIRNLKNYIFEFIFVIFALDSTNCTRWWHGGHNNNLRRVDLVGIIGLPTTKMPFGTFNCLPFRQNSKQQNIKVASRSQTQDTFGCQIKSNSSVQGQIFIRIL